MSRKENRPNVGVAVLKRKSERPVQRFKPLLWSVPMMGQVPCQRSKSVAISAASWIKRSLAISQSLSRFPRSNSTLAGLLVSGIEFRSPVSFFLFGHRHHLSYCGVIPAASSALRNSQNALSASSRLPVLASTRS